MNVTASSQAQPGPEAIRSPPQPRSLADLADVKGAQPNELDRKRIARGLVTRERYRYVSPSVRFVEKGYLIESPCCSRRIDPEGGVIDVALLQHEAGEPRPWSLYRKDHTRGAWELHRTFERLQDLLALLNRDPQRLFWQ